MKSKAIEFKDLNFKLAVIQELMYNKCLIEPEFDVYEFIESYDKRKIDVDEEGYEPIPEVLQYFENFEVPEELAKNIDYLSLDGGNEIYLQVCPYWDGEDDVFNIKSADDAVNFPNLKEVILFYDKDQSILEQFKKMGIEAEWL